MKHSSFSAIALKKVGNVGIFMLLKFENEQVVAISNIIFSC